jgi:hypothetical protein
VRRLGRLLLGAPPALEAGRNRRNPQAVTCAASQAIGGGAASPAAPRVNPMSETNASICVGQFVVSAVAQNIQPNLGVRIGMREVEVAVR